MPTKLTLVDLAKACGLGNRGACGKLARTLRAAAVMKFSDLKMDDPEHPNKMPFTGTLLLVDQTSTKPPHGSRGHRIYVPADVAQKRLSGLIGMGVNYDADLAGHNPQHKVGVITQAWLAGEEVKVKGVVWTKDFPDAADKLKKRGLGMSMELANVYVRDDEAEVWHLEDFQFTGATILKKDAAAYFKTSLAAKAAASKKGAGMPKNNTSRKTERVAAAAGSGSLDIQAMATVLAKEVGSSVREALAPMVEGLQEVQASLEELTAQNVLEAAGQVDEEDDEEAIAAAAKAEEDDEEEEMDAAKADDESDDDESDDEDDDDDLDAELEDLEEDAPHSEPGEVNHAMKTKGKKTTTTKVGAAGRPFPGAPKVEAGKGGAKGGLVRAARSRSINAAAVQIKQLSASLAKAQKTIKAQAKANGKMQGSIDRLEAQVETFTTNQVDRRSVSTDVRNLLAKSNISVEEMRAAGQKLTPEQVDNVIKASGLELEPTKRIELKNKLLSAGLMDEGRIDRGFSVQ